MDQNDIGRLTAALSSVSDPRDGNATRHDLLDILVISVIAVVCGAQGWEDIEDFGRSKEAFLRRFLRLKHGVPSNDTFRRVVSRLDPSEFCRAFTSWADSVRPRANGDILALDGKTLRRSHDRPAEASPLHVVSVWTREGGMALAQMAVDGKSNEIVAIPALLDLLDVRGCVLTVDAAGCQRRTAQKVVEKGGDYVLALKANQPGLMEEVRLLMAEAEAGGPAAKLCEVHTEVDGGHGRVETRKSFLCRDVSWVARKGDWKGLAAVGMVVSRRDLGDKISVERRYYITSLDCGAERFAECVRGHWSIENSLHWVLDMSFREDESRIRKENGAEIFAFLRKLALGMLKLAPTKRGIKARIKRAGWDEEYLAKVIFGDQPK
jgi:predicted transposase YbfD/YdcC